MRLLQFIEKKKSILIIYLKNQGTFNLFDLKIYDFAVYIYDINWQNANIDKKNCFKLRLGLDRLET